MSWLVKFLQKDNTKVLAGNLLASFFGLLNFMLMVRMMSKSDFGLIAIFLSGAGLADLIRTGFIRQALVRQWVIGAENLKKPLIGSAWLLHIFIAIVITLLCHLVLNLNTLLPYNMEQSNLLIYHYPLLLLCSIPHQMESWLSQAKKRYVTMNLFRILVNLLLFLVLIFQYNSEIAVQEVIIYFIICNGLVSMFSLLNYGSIKEIIHAKQSQVVSLFNFGKYSLSTLAGSNLLKSTDTLLIGMMISSESAAIYALPFKVIELLEIPLRGFVMTSFNTLTKSFQAKQSVEYTKHFQEKIFQLTIAFLPIILTCLFLPGLVVQIIGGANYSESVIILQILSFAMFILPSDKFAGMALDSVNKPNQNAIKVWIMVITNLVGDLLVISLGGPLWMVAVVTILNISFGVFYGIIKNDFLNSFEEFKWTAVLKI